MSDWTNWIFVCAALVPFIALVSRRPNTLASVYFALLPFPLALAGEAGSGNICVSDMLIGIALLGMLLSGRRLIIGSTGSIVLLYLLCVGLSSLLSSTMSDALLGLGRMALVTLVPLLVFANLEVPLGFFNRCLRIYCFSAALLGIISLFYFATAGFKGSMYTLGIHKNSLGPIFGTAVVIMIAELMGEKVGGLRRRSNYIVLALAGCGLLLSLSRGGWVGTIAGILVVLFFTRRVRTASVLLILIVPLLAFIWSLLPSEATDYATNVSPDSYVLRTRFDAMEVAMDAFRKNPWLGVGVGFRRTVEPHDVLVLALAESGIVGVSAFLLMVFSGVRAMRATMRAYGPDTEIYGLMLAGLGAFTVFHVQTLIDVYWRRGVGPLGWACVGMAISITSRYVAERDGFGHPLANVNLAVA